MSRGPLALAIALCTSAALALAACGGQERSAAAYCDTYESGFDEIKQQYPEVDQYSTSDENPLAMLVSVASAYGDIVALIGDMAEVAPDEIQTDVERVHDTLQSQIDSAGDVASDPLGALAGQLMKGIANSGALDRMDAYTVSNCGEHMFTVSPKDAR